MARYLLHHRHEPEECGVVFASFKGHHSRFATKRPGPGSRIGGAPRSGEGGLYRNGLRRLAAPGDRG
jgi:hypothetical protein